MLKIEQNNLHAQNYWIHQEKTLSDQKVQKLLIVTLTFPKQKLTG